MQNGHNFDGLSDSEHYDELDRDFNFTSKTPSANCHVNRSKRFFTTTVTHIRKHKRTYFFVIPKVRKRTKTRSS